MHNLLRVLALASCFLLSAGGHAQAVNGEWRGRLECSGYLPGISGPFSEAYGYDLAMNLASGLITGSKIRGTVEERFSGNFDGRRMRLLVDGKRTDRPSWWQIDLVGSSQDGTATLQGPLVSGGRSVRTCSLKLVSSEFGRVREAEAAANQREIARERRDVEVMEAAAQAKEDRAQAERAVREAAELKAAALLAERRALEIQSTGSEFNTNSNSHRGAANVPSETKQAGRPESRSSVERHSGLQKAAPSGANEKAVQTAGATSGRTNSDKVAADKSDADRVAAEKVALEKAAADKAAADRLAGDKAAAEKAAAEKAAAVKAKKQPIRVRNAMDL